LKKEPRLTGDIRERNALRLPIALANTEGDQFDFSTVGHAQYESEFRALGIDIDGQSIEEAAARIRATGYPNADEFAARNVLQPPAEADMLAMFGQAELK
jgi:hypothetical protein